MRLQQQAMFTAGSTITMVTAGPGNRMLVFHLELSCKLVLMASDKHVFCRSINLNMTASCFFGLLLLMFRNLSTIQGNLHFKTKKKEKGIYLLLPGEKVGPISEFFTCLLRYFHTFLPEEQLASEASHRLLWSVQEALAISSHANASECVLSLLTLFANQEACGRQESVKRSCVWYPRSQPFPLCEHMLILQPFNFQSACRSLLFLLLVCYSAGLCVALSTYRLR